MSIMPFVVSFIVNKHTNEIQSIDVLYVVNAKTKETTTTQQMQKPLPQRPRRVSVMFPSIAVYPNTPIMSRNFHLMLTMLRAFYFCNKSVAENKFYIHNMNLQNKKDTLPFKTEPRHESGLLSDNVSIYSLLNKS